MVQLLKPSTDVTLACCHVKEQAMVINGPKATLTACFVAAVLAVGCASPVETLQTRVGKIELQSGYPSDESVRKLYDELDFQRATQAYIWATPLVSMEALVKGNRDLGVGYNQISVNDEYTSASFVALTANNTTIYAGIPVDLRGGPVVVESPAGVYGVIDDMWQRPVVEVGPFGPDKGLGGKFLLVPPGYGGQIPAGYLPGRSLTNRVFYIGRAGVKDGNVKAAADLLATIKVYPLDQAQRPPNTRVVRTGGKPADTIPPQGFEYWTLLAQAVEAEPVETRDRFFHAMLKPLGIEKGKPFNPDARQKAILTEAATVGFRMAQTLSMAPRLDNAKGYPGTQWDWVLTLNPNQEAAGYSQLDERTDYTFEAITIADGMIKPIVGAGSQYMSAARDKSGAWLDGGRSYRLRVPANVPVKEFWAVTVYDNMTRSMVQTASKKPGIDSQQPSLRPNADGSVDLYFGPAAPAGRESNWIQTLPGKGWFAYFRWYGPTQAFFDKTWALPDIVPL